MASLDEKLDTTNIIDGVCRLDILPECVAGLAKLDGWLGNVAPDLIRRDLDWSGFSSDFFFAVIQFPSVRLFRRMQLAGNGRRAGNILFSSTAPISLKVASSSLIKAPWSRR